MLRAFILLVYFTYIVKTLPSLTEHEFSKTVQDGTKTIIIDGVKTKTKREALCIERKELLKRNRLANGPGSQAL